MAGRPAGRSSLLRTRSARGMTKIGLYPEGGHLVKRVVGVEGDVIECCDDEGRLGSTASRSTSPSTSRTGPATNLQRAR